MNKSKNAAAAVSTTNINTAKSSDGIRRGLKKPEVVALVEKFTFPATPFTMKEIFGLFGVEHWYITNYVKEHGKIVGDAPKAPGARGKAAKLYQMGS